MEARATHVAEFTTKTSHTTYNLFRILHPKTPSFALYFFFLINLLDHCMHLDSIFSMGALIPENFGAHYSLAHYGLSPFPTALHLYC